MKKLPVGISTLTSFHDDDYLYIDKTHHVHRLVDCGGKYYFLSRPRRFGKSLFIDTLKQAFLGNKKLFNNLYLEQRWDWNKQYPVIHLSFGSGVTKNREELENKISMMLDKFYDKEGITNRYHENSSRFSYLIDELYKKHTHSVVILVDEYDKPILDNINNKSIAEEMREGLKNLYSVIKDKDEQLKFVFLTGVSKFSKVSLFSGLNNLNDISLDPQYADICGYTQNEMVDAFADYLSDGNVDLAKLKTWYNGYSFAGLDEQKVYNPFDLLLFCDKGYRYQCYWFETATPNFLVKLIENNNYFVPEFDGYVMAESQLSSFDVDNIELFTLLFQTGYLTIKEARSIGTQYGFQLTYPNLEVISSLNNSLLSIGAGHPTKNRNLNRLSQCLNNNQFSELKELFNAHFASIPHDWYRNNKMGQFEGFYASVIYSYFAALGYDLRAEDVTSFGRIDLTMIMPDKILIIEFKLKKYGSAIDAIQQIKERRYPEKYQDLNKPTYLLGFSFNEQERNIEGYEWERL